LGKKSQLTQAEHSHRLNQIVHRKIAGLKLDPMNPRLHSPRQVRQIAKSIEVFGFNVPVLIDANDKVIAGHGRILACQTLGRSEVPTIRLDHLSEAQARAFMIADNRLTENSVWDDRLLAEQFLALSVLDLDFSLEVTGFDMGEIDFRMEGLNSPAAGERDPADDLSVVPTGPPVTRPGDIWALGDNLAECANALEPGAHAALMQGKQAQMSINDPPYNLRIDGNVSGLGKKRHREFAMGSGEMTESGFRRFLAVIMSLSARHSVEGSLHFVFMDWRHMAELLAAAREVFPQVANVCVWVKDKAGMGSLYAASMNSSASLEMVAGLIAITFNSGALAATGATSGTMPARILSRGQATRATCSPCIRRSNRSRWWPTPSWIALRATTSCSMDFSAAARP
jgi:hypothetical protein